MNFLLRKYFKLFNFTFHLNIHNSKISQFLQVLHFIGFRELTESSIESSLAFIEIVRAHCFPADGVVRILSWVGKCLQLAC